MKEDSKPLHVLPINDILPHIEEGIDCPCIPKIQTGEFDKETGIETVYQAPIIIHNAWDKRK